MATPYEIPLTAEPQTFQIALAGTTYTLTLVWNQFASNWILDIADNNSVPIVQGIPLVTGTDLLAQYGHLNFGGQLIVQTDHDLNATPTLDNLGSNSHLYFVVS